MNDAELARFHDGDPELFRELVETRSSRLIAFATRLCGDPDEAADLAQEAWVLAFRRRARFRGDGPLLSWLMSIARSVFLSRRRTAERREDILAANPGEATAAGTARIAQPGDCLAQRRIAEALGGLPDPQRDAVVARLIEGWSTRECARRLGVAEGTVKSRLSRANDSLKRLLKELEP